MMDLRRSTVYSRPAPSPLRKRAAQNEVAITIGGIPVTDITTKLILAVIALGVWVNIFTSASPDRQAAVQEAVQHTDHIVGDIADNISRIADGVCRNNKLC
jgi:hypothetical protein